MSESKFHPIDTHMEKTDLKKEEKRPVTKSLIYVIVVFIYSFALFKPFSFDHM